MKRVREFRRDDIAEVAALWQKVFRPREAAVPASLTDYFARVFFDSPWRQDDLPSWVYLGAGGRAVGFIGVLPRPMAFDGRPIRAAVATQLMVEPHAGAGIAAIELIKQYLAGPQDLAWTDGANDSVQKLWVRLGGETAYLYSQDWKRVLRPARQAARLLRGRRALRPLLLAAQPLCRAFDAAVARLPLGPYRLPAPEGRGEEATAETLLKCYQELASRRAVRPEYDAATLGWLLGMVRENKAHGRLRQIVVRGGAGELLGWYLYYVTPGAEAKVLQFGAKEGAAGLVLRHLFRDARAEGGLAVSGPVDPRYLRDLADSHCRFTCLSLGVLIHARDKDLRLAIHRGDAFLSRLEGEWWLRFGGDRFEDAGPAVPKNGNAVLSQLPSPAPRPRLARVVQ